MQKKHIAAALLLTVGMMDVDASHNASASSPAQHPVLPGLQEQARNGDANAQYLLGTRYRLGEGVSPDEYEAFSWYLRAAEEGHPAAQFYVGLMYLNGEGVTASDDAALEWFEKSAQAGNGQAKDMLDYVLNNDFTIGC